MQDAIYITFAKKLLLSCILRKSDRLWRIKKLLQFEGNISHTLVTYDCIFPMKSDVQHRNCYYFFSNNVSVMCLDEEKLFFIVIVDDKPFNDKNVGNLAIAVMDQCFNIPYFIPNESPIEY